MYYTSTIVLKVPAVYLLLTDFTNFSENQYYYQFFLASVPIGITLTFTFASNEITKYVPNINFYSLYYHAKFWGNIVIPALCLTTIFLVYTNN